MVYLIREVIGNCVSDNDTLGHNSGLGDGPCVNLEGTMES